MLTLGNVDKEDFFAISSFSVNHAQRDGKEPEDIELADEIANFGPAIPPPVMAQPANARIHSDLHYLTPHTVLLSLPSLPLPFSHLLDLIDVQFAKWLHVKLPNLILIDCRYPYEYEGGHINGSINLHSDIMIHDTLLKEPSWDASRPPVVVFHCEYSSCRGPARYLLKGTPIFFLYFFLGGDPSWNFC